MVTNCLLVCPGDKHDHGTSEPLTESYDESVVDIIVGVIFGTIGIRELIFQIQSKIWPYNSVKANADVPEGYDCIWTYSIILQPLDTFHDVER